MSDQITNSGGSEPAKPGSLERVVGTPVGQPCQHETFAIHTTFNAKKDQYEWHCRKCGEVVRVKTMLDTLLARVS